jgi:hypothetical protein
LIGALEITAVNEHDLNGSRGEMVKQKGLWCNTQKADECHDRFGADKGILGIFVFKGLAETKLCAEIVQRDK